MTRLLVLAQDHLQPILAVEAKRFLEGSDGTDDTSGDGEDDWADAQEPMLLGMLAEELGVAVEDVLDFECSLHDTQPASLSGAAKEFLCSGRIDNLASCFVATEALVEYASDPAKLAADGDIAVMVLFDDEEVGSGSTAGAGSPIMGEAVRRVTSALAGGSTDDDTMASALHRSFVLSVDMAHAIHPNYQNKHEKSHAPHMNEGMVIKSNANQRYASNGVTSFIVRELARRADMPIPQEFVVRNDCPCGSTIGPIISANTGIRAVDIGMPQLSMHSIREMMGVRDLTYCLQLFGAFYSDFRAVDEMMEA
jgi:aspartyl aminopeptidase